MTTTSASMDERDRRIAALEAELASSKAKLASVTSERDKLRRAYEQLKEEVELMRRRLYVAKAERVDTKQLELEFAEKKKALEALVASLEQATVAELGELQAPPSEEPKAKPKPKGRRDLSAIEMPEERIELLDPAFEGKAERIGFEESYRYGYRRGGPVRIVVARATYKTTSESGTTFSTVAKPRELFEKCLLAPSLFARILMLKYGFGMPFFRVEQMLAQDGIDLGRAEMCRYAENAGATLGAIVLAMRDEALRAAFCLSTDATGCAIRPEPLPQGGRQPCRKGHFFVVLADRDHVFFEYQPEHTSAAVCDMFRGFGGYIQADAHAIYDALYRGDAVAPGTGPPVEVGCWSHVRRKFWEAACAKYEIGREGLLRIHILFQHEESWKKLPPAQRLIMRQRVLAPLVDDFFTWARAEYDRHPERGLVSAALGYAVRQEQALRRFLHDGRLAMTNNRSENALRTIATGRKAWLFFGSDDHASAAANLFSLIASCKLHVLDAETYLDEMLRVMPHWPRDRYIELAPKYWARTRARLDPAELARQVGPLTVPPPLEK